MLKKINTCEGCAGLNRAPSGRPAGCKFGYSMNLVDVCGETNMIAIPYYLNCPGAKKKKLRATKTHLMLL